VARRFEATYKYRSKACRTPRACRPESAFGENAKRHPPGSTEARRVWSKQPRPMRLAPQVFAVVRQR
jgi:hypothetical protein